MNERALSEPANRIRASLPFGLQFSLAELLLVALFVCVGAAAAKSGGLLAWLVVETTIVLSMAFLVAAIFARRTAQAFAIGFVLGVAGHGLCLLYFGASEFDPDVAQLPFSKIVAPIWRAMDPDRFVSLTTGNEVPAGDVQSAWATTSVGGELILTAPDGSGVEAVERPARQDFMLVAHALGAAAAGYLMGKLASVLYRRRDRTIAEPDAFS